VYNTGVITPKYEEERPDRIGPSWDAAAVIVSINEFNSSNFFLFTKNRIDHDRFNGLNGPDIFRNRTTLAALDASANHQNYSYSTSIDWLAREDLCVLNETMGSANADV
jgi:hypothetical protein